MDLLSSRPFWPIRDGLPTTFPSLLKATTCDVLVVGGGVCGALITTLLNDAGIDVLVLDRREVAHGSTAGNTGLMLYELDAMLHRLARGIGREQAERAYRRCHEAIFALERIVRRTRIDGGFARKPNLFLAASAAHVPRLRREFAAREAAGFPVEWWSRRQIENCSTLPHPAAILSPDAAQLDPYRLTYGLMHRAAQRGARVHDRTAVTRWTYRKNGIDVITSRGHRVRARRLIVATGYEAEAFLPRRVGALHSTFVLVSEPVEHGFAGWPLDGGMLWDTGDPYLYLRTTSDGRAMIGGYDEPFHGPRARDRLLGAKTAALQRRFKTFFPKIPLEVATAWAGTFGVSADGLPFIGQHPRVPHTWFALGFGGNGTTFSVIAAEIIRDALLGRTDPDAAFFGFERTR